MEKPTQGDKKPGPKMFPESDVIALKRKVEKSEDRVISLQEELADTKSQLRTMESQLKIAKTNDDDEGELSSVKQHLLEESKEVEKQRKQAEKDLAKAEERVRLADAKEIVADLREKGIETDIDTLLGEEDMGKKSSELYTAHLAKENEALRKGKEEESPGSVFEDGTPAVMKKSVQNMSDEDFEKHWQSQMAESLSRK